MIKTDELETTLPAGPTPLKNDHHHDDEFGPGSVETVIKRRAGWIAIDWAEMVRAREVLYNFVLRDVTIRYKQTILGVAWAVLQPLFTMLVYALIFGRYAKIGESMPAVPYPVFVFIGLTLWLYFSGAVTTAGLSLVSQQNLVTKVYFPRLFVPMACVGTYFVDLVISLGVFGILMLYYRVAPSWQTPLIIPMIGLMTLATMGVGCLCAALTVLYRDFRFIVAFGIQILMFLTPVIYPSEMLPKAYQRTLSLNPMFGLVEGCRSALLGSPWHPESLAISSVSAVAWFLLGLYYFRRTERRFADLV